MDNQMKPLAIVNNQPIYSTDVDELLMQIGQRGQSLNNPQGRAMVLEQIIAQKLFLADALRNVYEREPAFKEQLRQVREQLLIQYAMNKAVENVKVTDEEVKKFFDENPEQFAGQPVVSASHILVDSEDKANEILGKINAGEISFEDAAREYSSCPSSQQGGSLGEFGPRPDGARSSIRPASTWPSAKYAARSRPSSAITSSAWTTRRNPSP